MAGGQASAEEGAGVRRGGPGLRGRADRHPLACLLGVWASRVAATCIMGVSEVGGRGGPAGAGGASEIVP